MIGSETKAVQTSAAPTTTAVTASTAAPTTTVAPTTIMVGQEGPRTDSDLVFLTRREDGITLTLDILFPAEPAGAPIVIGPLDSAIGDLVEQGDHRR